MIGSGWEMVIVGIVALLLFGKRLPEVARSVGQGIVEFKKGVSGIQSDIDTATTTTYSEPIARPEHDSSSDEESAPKFEPPA